LSISGTVLSELIEQKLLNLHTAFFAKVLSVSGNNAKIQPLNMIKANGKQAQKQAVITVPIMKNVRKFSTKTVTVTTEMDDKFSMTIPTISTISAGDIVYCLCGERDITETKKGNFATPPTGHHRISDAVVVGVI
jgi:hypothetical protein